MTHVQPQGTAIITGGSAGIGKAVCENLLDDGWEVVSMSRRSCDIRHERLHNIEVDLSDREATGQAAAEAAQQFDITTIVHNAGIIRADLLPDVKFSDLDTLLDLHIGSAIQLVQAALPTMKAAHFGRIVLMSSRAALGLPTRTSYSATKSGMIGMTRTWALELAAEGITVNPIAPGPIGTDMFYDVIDAGSDKEKAIAAGIPVQRLGRADDVARAVRFFVEPANSFITGQVLYVCGGASVGTLTI